MSIFRNDTLGSWTRGGQAIVHNVRMTTQVFFQTLMAALVIWVGGTIWYALEKANPYERFVTMKLLEASFRGDVVPGAAAAPILFRTPRRAAILDDSHGPDRIAARAYDACPCGDLSNPRRGDRGRLRGAHAGLGMVLFHPHGPRPRLQPVRSRRALRDSEAGASGAVAQRARQHRDRGAYGFRTVSSRSIS